jgi:mercuric ion binding protein
MVFSTSVVWVALPVMAVSAQDAETEVVTFEISGMITRNCPVLVESAVRRIEGVRTVEASLERRTAVVRYDPSRTSHETIRRVIQDQTGFRARVR